MEPEKKSNGAFIGLIVIIIILIVGGVYIWQSNKAEKTDQNQNQSETITNQDSDQLDNLEAELKTTDTSTGVDVNAVY